MTTSKWNIEMTVIETSSESARGGARFLLEGYVVHYYAGCWNVHEPAGPGRLDGDRLYASPNLEDCLQTIVEVMQDADDYADDVDLFADDEPSAADVAELAEAAPDAPLAKRVAAANGALLDEPVVHGAVVLGRLYRENQTAIRQPLDLHINLSDEKMVITASDIDLLNGVLAWLGDEWQLESDGWDLVGGAAVDEESALVYDIEDMLDVGDVERIVCDLVFAVRREVPADVRIHIL